MSDDIVLDILNRVAEAVSRTGKFDEILADQIEQQVRQDWGGSDLYISHGQADRIARRNDKINAIWDGGNKDARALATRFGLSVKQILRIVGR
jgi:Mor family transcriptional regulator